jgi:outer membrane lipoprotein carrier protein
MKKTTLVIAFLAILTSIFAQKKSSAKPNKIATPSVEQTDPEAQALLEKARQKYEAYTSIEADFSLSIEMPNRKKEVQKGKMYQSGDRYRVNLDEQEIICDGKSTYMYLKKNKEVQINDAESNSEANSLSPKAMLRMYNQGNYICYKTGDGDENGKKVTYIEVKPTDRNSAQYSKLRVGIDPKNNQITSMFTVNRDGSRFKLTIAKITTNKSISDSQFTFNKANYPNVHIEDLRTN